MLEFTFIGRGGQGIVVAGEILAKALFYQGFYVKSFPAFGTERRGAPVRAFLRVSNQDIKESFQIYHPDYFVIFNSSQANGLPLGVSGLINASDNHTVHGLTCFNANSIALENHLGSETNPIINTAMLGGITALLEELDFKNLEKAICETLPKNLWEKNIKSARSSYELVLHQTQARHWTLKCA